MTDLSILSRLDADLAGSTSEGITAALGRLGEVFSEWNEHARTAPVLRQVAHEVLSKLLPYSSAIKNPDILFINIQASDGTFASSISLTDALLQALTQGLAGFMREGIQVYSRPDSVQEADVAPGLEGLSFFEMLGNGLDALPNAYKDRIDVFWAEAFPVPGSESEHVTRRRMCANLYAEILMCELRLQRLEGQINEADEPVLAEGFSGSNLYRVSMRSGTGSGVLSSAFIIPRTPQTRSVLTPSNCEGNVFLISAATGLELYDSLEALDQQLRARLQDTDQREYLLQDLLLRVRVDTGVDQGAVIHPFYSYSADDPSEYLMDAIRHKQIQDFDFLLNAAQQTRQDLKEFLPRVNASSQLSYLDSAYQYHFQQLFTKAIKDTAPDWLKNASASDKAQYRTLVAGYQQHAQQADVLMAGLESKRGYALGKIKGYVLRKLGYLIDPEEIFISILEELELNAELTRRCTYRKSLLDFVVDGLPLSSDDLFISMEVPEHSQNPALNFPFVEAMCAELDVQQHFELDSWRCLSNETFVQRLAGQRGCAIELSALAARLQGHLRDELSQQLIQWARSDSKLPDTEITLCNLAFQDSRALMKDVLVFCLKRNNSEHYVLYAPGAPGGREMFEFSSSGLLREQPVAWMSTLEGLQYILDQVPERFRVQIGFAIRKFQNLVPGAWSSWGALLVPVGKENFETTLIEQVRAKKAQELSDFFSEYANQDLSQTYSHRRLLALLDLRIDALENLFATDIRLQSYREYVREEGKQWIADYLKSKGIDRVVDPDTVCFKMEDGRDITGWIGMPSTDVTLTSLLMNDWVNQDAYRVPWWSALLKVGIKVNWSLRLLKEYTTLLDTFMPSDGSDPRVYSTVGQDLSVLPSSALRELLDLPLGAEYINLLKAKLNNRDGAHLYRRALLAKKKYFTLYRDVLSGYLNGQLDKEQYHWLIPLISSIDNPARRNPASAKGWVSTLVFTDIINFAPLDRDRIMSGALTFVGLDGTKPNDRLIYTPDAPDGIKFRTEDEVATTMKHFGMPAYYHDRARYRDQATVKGLVVNLEQDPQKHRHMLNTRGRSEHRIATLEQLYEVMIQRMIDDVDDQTESAAENAAAIAYTATRWTGSILLLPFPPGAAAWGVLHTTIDIARGALAYQDGDRAAALEFFVSAGVGGAFAGGSVASAVAGHMGIGFRIVRWASTSRLPFPVI